MQETKLKKGLKVICVDDTIKPERLLQVSTEFPNWVKKGKEYTIRHIIVQTTPTEHIISFLLEEVSNPVIWFENLQIMHEPGFHVSRFAVYKDQPPMAVPNFSAN